MAIHVLTKDCTALSDAELGEMADLCERVGTRWEVGTLSKQAEEWVLVTVARDPTEQMLGFSLCTLERIGGTPSVLIGLGAVERATAARDILGAIRADQFRRAVLAFPDEDVLVGARINRPDAFDVLDDLADLLPRPGHKPSGEDRAWGRRLQKRFGIETSAYSDREFRVSGDGNVACLFHYERPGGCEPSEVDMLFEAVDTAAGDLLIACGWAMAEYLETFLP